MSVTPDRPMLIVEDSPEDYEATVRTLGKAGLTDAFVHCEDGDDALNFLYRRGPYATPDLAPRPRVILLDLNLPGTDGREVLTQIKQDEDLKVIPVLIFTTSDHHDDVQRCYEAGANSYIRKSVDLAGFTKALMSVKQFWFTTAILPD
jgi:CheY-like chemotaxis protein